MYPAPYPPPDAHRPMPPRSHAQPDQHFPDLHPHPQQLPSPHVPSPQSSPSNAGDNSPVDYFPVQNMSAVPQQQWAMQSYQGQGMPGQYVDSSFAPQIKTEANGMAPLHALYSGRDGGYLQDPSQFNLDPYVPARGLDAGGNTGCDRNKPRARQPAGKRLGACARCRRLKMKCTFTNPTDDVCSRCTAGNYECHFPGRKPRSPGMRVVLQQRIREKNAEIDKVLSKVNPGPTMPTPLTLVPARLPLSEEERTKYRDVLAYLERTATQAGQRIGGDNRPKFDISALEDPSEAESDSDEEMVEGVVSPSRAVSPKGDHRPMDTILEVAAPTGLMAIAALETLNTTGKSIADSSSSESSHKSIPEGGIASETYFLPGSYTNLELRRLIVERQAAPEILLSGLVTPEDVQALFDMQAIIPILDENIHTPATVLARCPFLFTVICTVASRYYKEKPHIHGMAIHFAKAAAANAIIDGWKTVEMCQAFALWSVYNPPARRWEEDRAWCYTGIAFRLATELNLSRIPEGPPADERQEREQHNRTRMWLMCYIMDRCLSIQSGKAWMVQEDVTVRNVSHWLKNYKYHNSCDGYLTSLTELLCIMSRFVGTVNPAFGTSSVESVDVRVCPQIAAGREADVLPFVRFRHHAAVVMQITLIYCVFNYCRLVICCVGMQLNMKRRAMRPNELFAGCVQAATSLVKLMVEDFVPTGFVRYFPELVYVHSAFASVVLMKCLRPEYNAMLDIQQEERIIDLVQRLFETWTSDKYSLDEKHNTQLYARFLKQLMEPHVARLAERKARAHAAQAHADANANANANANASAVQPNGHRHPPAQSPAGLSQQQHSQHPQQQQHPHQQHPHQQQSPVSPLTPDSASTLFPGQDPALGFGSVYDTEVDVSKAAAELAAQGMLPSADVTWDQLFAPAPAAGAEGGAGLLSGPFAGGDLQGMMGDECLAAMMGLGNDMAWFLSPGPPSR
ncbi:hypothetical protein BD413DRAFT_603880 [Trametes elegans]|nr:hypothetical protein BD413DRAFT_603880 [Trametes elegans]